MDQVITPSAAEKAQFAVLDSKIKTLWRSNQSFLAEIVKLAEEMRSTKLYLVEFTTYDEYAQATFGRTANALKCLAYRERKKEADRLPLECGPQKDAGVTATPTYPPSTISNKSKSSVSAKKDPTQPVCFAQPKPELPLEKPMASRVDLRFEITQAVRELDSLLHRGGFEYEVFNAIKHCLAHLTKAQYVIQQMLPGMEIAESERSKSRGTQGEIENFCVSLGLPALDGEICYNKWKGNGWLVGKQPIKCWKSTIRSWFAAGYMPSQRTNGQPKPETLADQSRRKIRQIVNEGLREVTP